jgi:CRP-like cAMP-binding protein
MRRFEEGGHHREEPECAGLLREVDLFSRLDRLALAQLAAHLEVREVQDGCTVLSSGEPGDALYVVSRGTFGVFTSSGGNTSGARMATVGPAGYFGEVALLTGEPGSTAVRAEGDGQLLRLERSRFLELVKRYPTMATCVIAGMNRSLRAAEERVAPPHRWGYSSGVPP